MEKYVKSFIYIMRVNFSLKLAEGLDRNRNEPCVLIWDVVNTMPEASDRTRHSFSEGPVTKPFAELGKALSFEC